VVHHADSYCNRFRIHHPWSCFITPATPTEVPKLAEIIRVAMVFRFDQVYLAISVLLYYPIWLLYSSHCQAMYNISNKVLPNKVSHVLPAANYYFSLNNVAIIALCVVSVGLWSSKQCIWDVDVPTLYVTDKCIIISSLFHHLLCNSSETGMAYIMPASYVSYCVL